MNQRLSDFVRIARQLAQERTAARPVVELVRRNPAGYLGRPLPRDWMTAGMAQELTDAAYEMHQNAPAQSGALATLATQVAAELDPGYPRVMRAQLAATAWKEVANAHRYRSDYDGALRALDRAERELDGEPTLTYDAAVLALARATTLRDLDRLAEAYALVQSAVEVFREHGDESRVAQCGLLTGIVQHGQGQRLAAREAYRRAAALARDAGDIRTVGSAYINLGVLDAESGNTNAALDSLQQARAIFVELGARAEVARANYGIAGALLGASRYDAAIDGLREARSAFQSLRMAEEAGLAGVRLVEAYLALERRDAARAVIVTVIDEFRAASLNERALVALAYLRDLGPAARPTEAQHVHSYLTRLRHEPALLFRPPEEQRA